MEKLQLYSYRLATGQSINARSVTGAFWITMEGDVCDYVLDAEDQKCMTFTGPGLLVAESLNANSMLVLDPLEDACSFAASRSLHV